MTDRGPYGNDPDPTEAFPPLPADPAPTPPSSLPPIGADRDPDPTRVMPPTPEDNPTTAMPSTGGPYEPGPPFGGPPGGGGGGGPDEPPYEPEPEPQPWYRQPGPLAALIAGIAAVIVGIIALIVWTGGDDGGISGQTLPSVATSSSTTTLVPDTTTSTSTSVPDTTTSTPTTTSSTTTTTSTTTTLAPTTTEATTTTTLAPTTTAASTTLPPPPGQSILDALGADPDLSSFSALLACTGLDQDVLDGDALTVLAPSNEAFTDMDGVGDMCTDPDAIEPIVLLHLVSVDLTYQQIFSAPELQTLGALLPIDRNLQTIGSGGTKIVERDVAADPGIIQVLDGVITP